MYNTSKDIIGYFSTIASEDHVLYWPANVINFMHTHVSDNILVKSKNIIRYMDVHEVCYNKVNIFN